LHEPRSGIARRLPASPAHPRPCTPLLAGSPSFSLRGRRVDRRRVVPSMSPDREGLDATRPSVGH
jgi:hypothetical protein